MAVEMSRSVAKRDLSLRCLAQTLLTADTHQKAKARAESKGLSMSTYLRTLILNDLDKAKGD